MFRDEFKERYTTIPFAIHSARCENRVKNVITHQHKELELIALTEGSADFYINSRYYKVKKGDAVIIPPFELHRIRTSESETTSYLCICFDLSLLCDEILKNDLETQDFSGNHVVAREADADGRLFGYICDAFYACEQREAGWELRAVGNMSLLFGALKERGFFSYHLKNEKERDFGKKAMTYIIDNYSTSATSRDAASELYMNHNYFCRLFKRSFGACFSNYLLAYRLERAKAYLKTTGLSVTEIAFKVGFNNCSYFCKVFREATGNSPLLYRRLAKSE